MIKKNLSLITHLVIIYCVFCYQEHVLLSNKDREGAGIISFFGEKRLCYTLPCQKRLRHLVRSRFSNIMCPKMRTASYLNTVNNQVFPSIDSFMANAYSRRTLPGVIRLKVCKNGSGICFYKRIVHHRVQT